MGEIPCVSSSLVKVEVFTAVAMATIQQVSPESWQTRQSQLRFFNVKLMLLALINLLLSLSQANDLEETIKRIQGHKGVIGMMIVNNDGKRLTFPQELLQITF